MNSELSTNFVIPSTLYLHSCTVITGFDTDTQSISPFASSFMNTGRFFTHTQIFNSSAGICGRITGAFLMWFSTSA